MFSHLPFLLFCIFQWPPASPYSTTQASLSVFLCLFPLSQDITFTFFPSCFHTNPVSMSRVQPKHTFLKHLFIFSVRACNHIPNLHDWPPNISHCSRNTRGTVFYPHTWHTHLPRERWRDGRGKGETVRERTGGMERNGSEEKRRGKEERRTRETSYLSYIYLCRVTSRNERRKIAFTSQAN